MISTELDAVILAGGKSERLRGVVPPYHKPFLVVHGESLIVSAVRHAQSAGAERIIVVAVGENALQVSQMLESFPEVRIVLSGGGPGTALKRGLELCIHDRVLVLMSDNVHRPEDITSVCAQRYAVGVQTQSDYDAGRFTRYENTHWVEGSPTFEPIGRNIITWCGPIVINRLVGLSILGETDDKIGPHLGKLTLGGTRVSVKSYDVGVADVVRTVT